MIHSPADHHADSEESTEESVSDSEEEDEVEVEEDNCNSAGEEVCDQSHVYLWPRSSLGMKSNFLGLIPYANEITRLFVVT